MHRLIELQNKLNKSGKNGNPIITDEELVELRDGLEYIGSYFSDRSETIIASFMLTEARSVDRVIVARKD